MLTSTVFFYLLDLYRVLFDVWRIDVIGTFG